VSPCGQVGKLASQPSKLSWWLLPVFGQGNKVRRYQPLDNLPTFAIAIAMASDQTKVQLAKFPVAKTGQEAHDILKNGGLVQCCWLTYGLGKVPRPAG